MTNNLGLYGGAFVERDRNNPRTIIAHWVPAQASVLEVGPGDGVISRWLKQRKLCRTVGVEMAENALSLAQSAFDQLFFGSIEDETTMTQVSAYGPFDAIIFADVLEHLVNPWRTLQSIRPLLTPAGRVLLSVPNIAHWSVRLNLLFGRFDYTDGFIMDRTHLRWFTQKTARSMAQHAGYRVCEASTVFKPRFLRWWPTLFGYQIVLNLMPT